MVEREKEKQKLELKDLHPALRIIYEIECEVQMAFYNRCIKTREGEKIALNLTFGREKDQSNILGSEDYDNPLYGPITIPIYATGERWRVHFGKEIDGKLQDGLSVVLDGISSTRKGINELQKIAGEIQKIYGLTYTPALFHEGIPVIEKPTQPPRY